MCKVSFSPEIDSLIIYVGKCTNLVYQLMPLFSYHHNL